MDIETRQRARQIIKGGEGSINHMYLDTVGKVTVAVGNLIPNAKLATEHRFVVRNSGDMASHEQITTDYESVSGQDAGRIASYYKQFTVLILPEEDINKLLDQRMDEFEEQLTRDFNGFESYPAAAQIGILDMAFNLGNNGLVNKFPGFTAAARQQDWGSCIEQCHRRGISEHRNDETKSLFKECQRQS